MAKAKVLDVLTPDGNPALVWRIARSGTYHDASDALQDVALKELVKNAPELETETQAQNKAVGHAKGKMRDEQRKEKRRTKRLRALAEKRPGYVIDDPAAEMSWREGRLGVLRAVRRLTRDERRLIYGVLEKERTPAKTGRQFGISHPHDKFRRAVKKLTAMVQANHEPLGLLTGTDPLSLHALWHLYGSGQSGQSELLPELLVAGLQNDRKLSALLTALDICGDAFPQASQPVDVDSLYSIVMKGPNALDEAAAGRVLLDSLAVFTTWLLVQFTSDRRWIVAS